MSKNMSTLCSCPDILKEAEFKSDGLINMVEEILRQPSIQIVACLLLAALS
jgi:hypothetical protein